MILLDYPYTSDFLKETIVQFQLPVVATVPAKEIMGDLKVNWISERDAVISLRDKPDSKVYTNSENSIEWIEQNTQGTGIPEKIRIFKNKYAFRELIKEAYPDYFFSKLDLGDLDNLVLSSVRFPFIIKPIVGFFSLGVHLVSKAEDWPSIKSKIRSEMEATKALYPKEVVDNTAFVLEEYIEGEEYALDCYFDENGDPVILNVLHHVFKSMDDVSDRLYSSSEKTIRSLEKPILEFLAVISSKIGLRNFPLHIEFRMKSGKLIPIEVNPMRFGGWCTTADLTWYSYGINSYLSFFESQRPDWNKIFEIRQEKTYSLILLDNNSGIPFEEIAYFDFGLLAKDFERPLHIRKVHMEKYGVFGFIFTETGKGNEQELQRILHSDLRSYIKLLPSTLA
ncbi:ATP-grasp domain-containing protein [Arthrospiribacter ruber]|uniref:ATP-grasp domain-containing protein n=1 Tax=Arthrospiribacter ruber TaxID=2487934 RepID=A0A951IZY3_9BACT|nr:ATP-grasp domain-containing protein [Arthrospiribacter ruber]MBW3469444.1 ATP-grasp domain-containing protein [Arthrospiribacter ruber]